LRIVPKRAAPRANRLKRRIAPAAQLRIAAHAQAQRHALGRRQREGGGVEDHQALHASRVGSAQPKPIMPPQSCTASVTGPSTPQ
jgi:hypothetical protein